MEQRDPPRFGSSEGRVLDHFPEEPDLSPPRSKGFRRFPGILRESSPRHWSGRRIAVASLVSLGVLLALIGAGSWLLRKGAAVVHTQEKATLTFRQITLDPPPPAWLRGGSQAFLDRVAKQSKLPETFSILEANLPALRRAFELDPIVESVSKVWIEFPNRLIVRLAYHQPVATAAREYDVRLISLVSEIGSLPTEGKSLIVVAEVGRAIHLRAFGSDRKIVLDTNEIRLSAEARKLADLKKLLEGLWPPHELSESEEGRVVDSIRALVGNRLPNRTDLLVLDRSGTLLPFDLIDTKQVSPLIELYRFPAPRDPRDGHRWYTLDPKTNSAVPDRWVADAARLAGFLRDKILADKTFPALAVDHVHIHQNGRSDAGVFVQVGANMMFRWETVAPPHTDQALIDERRWTMLLEWIRNHPPLPTSPTYDDLEFTPRGVHLLGTFRR